MNRLEEYRALCARATPGIMRRGTSGICDDGTTAFKAVLEVDAKLFAQARQMGFDLLDEIARLTAERDDTTTITRDICYDHGEMTNYGAESCDKCGAKQPDRYPHCPGCGRRIERRK